MQGKLAGQMSMLGFDLTNKAQLDTLTADITQSSEIEGEILNQEQVRSSIAHLWFVTVHPFDDGNGRISRTITDMLLTRADEMPHRFYSMSAQIRKQRNGYYDILERTQKGDLNITDWLKWFLGCLEAALNDTEKTIGNILQKSKFWEKHRAVPMNNRQIKVINLLWDGFEGKLTSSKWAKITKCSADTALRDIQELISRNILRKSEEGGRNTNYELIL